MQNIKYLVTGIMVGGAFGAKLGEYLSTIMQQPNSFEWIESSMLLGSLIGLVLTLAIVAAVTAGTKKEDYSYYRSNEETTMSGA